MSENARPAASPGVVFFGFLMPAFMLIGLATGWWMTVSYATRMVHPGIIGIVIGTLTFPMAMWFLPFVAIFVDGLGAAAVVALVVWGPWLLASACHLAAALVAVRGDRVPPQG